MATLTLDPPKIQGNRVVYSWQPKGPFKASSYWVEYPGLPEVPGSPSITEGYFPVCVAAAALGDVSIILPERVDPRILQNWSRYIETVSRICFKKKANVAFENGRDTPFPAGRRWIYHRLYEPLPESVRKLVRISRFIRGS